MNTEQNSKSENETPVDAKESVGEVGDEVRIDKMLTLLQNQVESLVEENKRLRQESSMYKEKLVWLNQNVAREYRGDKRSIEVSNGNGLQKPLINDAEGKKFSVEEKRTVGDEKGLAKKDVQSEIESAQQERETLLPADKDYDFLHQKLKSVQASQEEVLLQLQNLQNIVSRLEKDVSFRNTKEENTKEENTEIGVGTEKKVEEDEENIASSEFSSNKTPTSEKIQVEEVEVEDRNLADDIDDSPLKSMLLKSLQKESSENSMNTISSPATNDGLDTVETEKKKFEEFEAKTIQKGFTHDVSKEFPAIKNVEQGGGKSTGIDVEHANSAAANGTLEKGVKSKIDDGEELSKSKKKVSPSDSFSQSDAHNKKQAELTEKIHDEILQKTPNEIASPAWLQNDEWEDPFAKDENSMDDDEFMKSFTP